MLNPFFLQGSATEQGLIQDLINEQLRMYGVEVYYIPRSYITQNTVIEELIESSFEDAYPIEAYVNNFEGYNDNSTILSKFGIQSTQEINLIISQERFETYIQPLLEFKNARLSTRPKEGDLVYFPLGDRLFEIKFVEHEKPFYQLQKNYVYELRCELFRYGDEVIDTGVDEIDDTLIGSDGDGVAEDGSSTILGGSMRMTLVGSATTAQAITGLVNNGIRSITINSPGLLYTETPTVRISSASTTGLTGIATAIVDRYAIKEVNIINPGFGYTATPEIGFVNTTGIGATASVALGNNIVGVITVTEGGLGYVDPPTVTFSGSPTVSAAATASLGIGGSVSAIYITDSGLGYTSTPTITLSAPPQNDFGDFEFNEIITGSQSGAKARVRVWNTQPNILELGNVSGTFVKGERIVGSKSGASHAILSIDDDPVDDGFAQNKEIQDEGDYIMDFNETNIFGSP